MSLHTDSASTDAEQRTGGRRWAPIIFIAVIVIVGATLGIGSLLKAAAPPEAEPEYFPIVTRDVAAEPVPSPSTPAPWEVRRLNVFGEEIDLDFVDEPAIQRYILAMSEQKIHTDFYTAVFEMTPERIDTLQAVIAERPELEHGHAYTAILTRWQDGDFTQAVEDHNSMWRLLGGDIGIAIRLSTPAEEAEILATYGR